MLTTFQQDALTRQEKRMILMIKLQRNACILIAFASIGLSPTTSSAKPKSITPVQLLETILPGEPWDRGVFSAPKTVMFQQAASGGTDATAVAKITLSYFTSTDCSGPPAPDTAPTYTTPDNSNTFSINTATSFGIVASSVWNVGNSKVSPAISTTYPGNDISNILSIAVTFKSTINNTPQTNFSGSSFTCLRVTCAADNECTLVSGATTRSFQLKTTATIGDPADAGVIACQVSSGDNFDLVAASLDSTQAFNPGLRWGPAGTVPGADSLTDGATNTSDIVTAFNPDPLTDYAAGLCVAYPTTVATGGYNTWFLPAKDQLHCLYTHRVAIGNFDLITNPFYWSSTEDSPNDAWMQRFDNGTQIPDFKLSPNGVRCVEAFTP